MIELAAVAAEDYQVAAVADDQTAAVGHRTVVAASFHPSAGVADRTAVDRNEPHSQLDYPASAAAPLPKRTAARP